MDSRRNRRYFLKGGLIVVVLVVLAVSINVGMKKGAGSSAIAPSSHIYRVIKIVDGDTIWVRGGDQKIKVRLLNVDTPELSGRRACKLGYEAAHFTETLLKGRKVYLIPDPAHAGLDIYGRALRYVITDEGMVVNIEIVRNGWSAYYIKYGKSSFYDEQFTEAENYAKSRRAGIWSYPGFLSSGYLENAKGLR